ncbi:hypothetical protein SAY86_020728 [Trapa natans]|uniref:Thaumatin-like protein n=1 Tax=Trapa natans TaxID=22666 RepID=A0AAN7R212_TRANT|nr:hypothetical protein SAY86_020728 [Trapa natans]
MAGLKSLPLLQLILPLFFVSNQQVVAVTLTFMNNCPYTVWPATLTAGGHPQLSTTGFELASGSSNAINDVPASWSGRLWGRTLCAPDNAGRFTCQTADCGSGKVECGGAGGNPPASLAELTLNGSGGNDFYDISLVDGFSIPLSLTPHGGTGGCSATSCPSDINSVCPPELSLKGSDGKVVGCKSACLVFNKPEYCCKGDNGTPETCPPTNYSKIFKDKCPQAYSYAYDDKTSTFTCPAGANYVVTFCP